MKHKITKTLLSVAILSIGLSVINKEVHAENYHFDKTVDEKGYERAKMLQSIAKTQQKLPHNVQAMVKDINFYKKEDGILGYSQSDNISLNMKYLNTSKNQTLLKEVHLHELGHVVDYKSFTSDIKSKELFDKEQEIGRRNYHKGVSFDKSEVNNNDGYRSKNLINIKPNTNYTIKTPHANDTIVLFYDKDKKSTHYKVANEGVIQSGKDDKYAALYTVKLTSKLDDLSFRESSSRNSLSRDDSFKKVYQKTGNSMAQFEKNKHEYFAEFFKEYMLYKQKTINKNDVSSPIVLEYMKIVDDNNFKVTKDLKTRVDKIK